MNQTSRIPAATSSSPGHIRLLGRSGAVLAAVCVAWLLYAISPLPSLESFDRHDEPLARVRMAGLLLYDVVTMPQETWVYWEGPHGTKWLLDRVGVLLYVGVIFLVSLTVGGAILSASARLASGNDATVVELTLLERAAFSAGVGLSAVSLLVRTLGFFQLPRGQFLGLVSAAAVLGFAGLAWGLLSRTRRARGRATAHASRSSTDGESCAWLWLSLPFVVVILLGGLLPPLDFDVLEYHLQAPKEFFQLGRVAFLPHNVYANMPLGCEMFALLGMQMTGDWWTGALVGKTIIAGYALVTGLALFALGQRIGGKAVGALAAVLYLSTPWTIRIANLGLNENALALYLVLTAHAAYLWAATRRIDLLLLAGFFAGSAASIKYTGLLFVVAPLVPVVIYIGWKQSRPELSRRRGVLACTGLVILSIVAACWPWYAANLWNTGNPVYPLFDGWFGGSLRGDEFAAQWNAAHRPPNFSPSDLASELADFAWRSEWHNPLLSAFAVLALVFARTRWVKRAAAYLAFYFVAWWLLTHRLDRFWAPAVAAMAMLGGGAAMIHAGRPGQRIVAWSMAVWVALSLLWAVHPASLCGYTRLLAPYDWLRQDPARIPLWRQNLNELAGRGRAVLAVGDAAVFDLYSQVYYNTVFDPWRLREWLGDSGDLREQSDSLHAELLARNIDYVYVHWAELDRYRRTYDRDFRRSDFITPQLFDRLMEHGVLTSLAPRLAGANVSLFTVNELEE